MSFVVSYIVCVGKVISAGCTTDIFLFRRMNTPLSL
jgi:hypothetical protein